MLPNSGKFYTAVMHNFMSGIDKRRRNIGNIGKGPTIEGVSLPQTFLKIDDQKRLSIFFLWGG